MPHKLRNNSQSQCYSKGEDTTSTILIRGARQLVTLHGARGPRRGSNLKELSVISDGSMLIRDGVVQEVGATRRVENLAEARKAIEVNAVGKVVMPGFVDSHTHLAFPAPGSADAAREAALKQLRNSSGNLIRLRVRRSLETMARHGTTTVEAKTVCNGELAAETKLLRVLASLRKRPLDMVSTILFNLEEGAEATGVPSILPQIRQRQFAGEIDLKWTANARVAERASEFIHAAAKLGFGCKLHADGPDCSHAIAAAMEHQALSVGHLEHATVRDALNIARSGVIATLLPATSFREGAPYAPARTLLDAGAALALASDFSCHLPSTLNMQTVISLACAYMGFSAEEAICASTINAAYALGLGETVGSLEPGKRADVVLLNVPDYRDLAHHLGTNLVHTTIKSGEVIYRECDVTPQVLPGACVF